jgi:hypothetical protein
VTFLVLIRFVRSHAINSSGVLRSGLLSAKFSDFRTQPSNGNNLVGLFNIGHLPALSLRSVEQSGGCKANAGCGQFPRNE